jgi:KDO2-lipid IV(A) lauroyltransferase
MKLPNTYTKQEKNKIINSMWSNYGMTFIEYVFLNNFKNSKLHVDIKGEKILNQISLSGNPVIFVSGHFANFELMSMEITKKKINLATIYRPLNNFFLNPFMEYMRKKYICKNQIKKGLTGVKESIKYINKNNSIALMIDQRVSEGEKIKFFNQDALTTTLPAQLALKYNLDVIPIFIERKNISSFVMTVYEPLKSSNFKNKLQLSRKLSQILEGMIMKNPNQWIWTHDRWK